MAIIDLPTGGYVVAKPKFLDFASSPPQNFGGVQQKIIRPGSRFALELTIPRKRYAAIGDEGAMKWISRLLQANHGEARYPWPQPGVQGFSGTQRVNAAGQQGSTLTADGFPANAAYREGQFFNFEHQGNQYLHVITADGNADGSGIASLPIFPMLRVEPNDNALLDFSPVIQGDIDGDETEWEIDFIKTCGLTFIIREKR